MFGRKMPRGGFFGFVLCTALLLGFAGAACALDTWDGTTGTGFTGGDGSPGDPYQIATGAQLAYMAKQVRDDATNYNAKSYKLTDDIDLAGHEWPIVIGWGFSAEFKGTFDGDDHKILNFRYTGTHPNVGLFGWVAGATIKNVHLVGVHIAPTYTGATLDYYVGGIAGVSDTGSTIEGCSVTGSITGGNTNAMTKNSVTGGIAGNIRGIVTGCSFMGTVTGGNAAVTGSDSYTGGIVGTANNAVSACSAGGSVVGGDGKQASYTGGIAGFVSNANGKISNCSSSNSVEGGDGDNTSRTGGVAGEVESNTTAPAVEKSYSFGSVKDGTGGTIYTGGVVGWASKAISGCYWNTTANAGGIPLAVVGVGHDNAGGGQEANAVGLAAPNAFVEVNKDSFDKDAGGEYWGVTNGVIADRWGIDTPGSAWFYPTFDTGRPRLKAFFNAAGTQVLPQFASASLTPNAVTIKAGDPNATVTVSVLDGLPFAISGVSPATVGGVSLSHAAKTVTVTPGATTTAAGPTTITITYSVDDGTAATATFNLTVLNGSTGGGGGGGGGSTSSDKTEVSSVKVVIDGTEHTGTAQPDGTILITVPAGTDISNLTPSIAVSAGATYTPKGPHDFTKGPLEITVTAQDGTTKKYKIGVVVQSQQPVAGTFVNPAPSACTGTATRNAGGTFDVVIGIPFAAGFDPSTIQYISATIAGLNNPSFFYTDANGGDVSIPTRTASSLLKIKGTAADPSKVVITSLRFWKKGDATEYYQNIPGGLKLSDIMGTTPNPNPSPSSGGSGGGGCDAGAMGLAALMLGGLYLRKKRA